MQKHICHCQDEYDFTNTPVMEAGRGAKSVLQHTSIVAGSASRMLLLGTTGLHYWSVSRHSADGWMVSPVGLSALVGKGLPETYLFMEVLEPPQPGPEQQALALCQIDSKCSCFKIVVRVCTLAPRICLACTLLAAVQADLYVSVF
jgi:hypothetical protein